MKKKNVLALAVMLSILQESSCFATSHNPADSYLNDGVYTEFVKSTKQSIVLNNKDAVYTFNKGASIAIDKSDYNDSYYIYNPISNSTNHSLTINVGGALTEGDKRYEFSLKPQMHTSERIESSAGISVSGLGSENTINMQNTNMNIYLMKLLLIVMILKVNIDINGSLNIASLTDKNILGGISIFDAERNDVDFDLKAKGDINISGALRGITAISSAYMAGGNIGNTNIDIAANSIKINANSEKNVLYSGTGIIVGDGNNQGRNVEFNITATGNDGININAGGFGYYGEGTVASNIIAKKGSINVNSELQGLRLWSNTMDEDKKSFTSINAKNDININSKYKCI